MTKDMTTGPITPLLVNFTIPLVLGNLFQLTYNAVDSIIVGKFVGEDALAAVGTSNPLMTLAILFINGVCLGAGILVSLAFGAGDTELVERQVSTTAIAGTVFSLVFSALCVLLATPLLRLMQVPEEILPIAVQYLRIVFAGLIFTFFYNFLAATMRALGDSKATLYFLLVSSILNVALDLAFVAGLGMGVTGAAIATVISQIASCVIGFAYMHRKYTLLRFSLRELRLDVKTAGRILHVGAPMAIQQSIVSCGFLFLQRLVNLYGESMIASYTVASRMENILLIPILGVQNTMATFAGQNMGAQRPDRVAKGLGQGVLVSLSMTLVLCLCQILGISLIIRAFQLDEAAAAICRLHLFSSAVAIPIFAVYFPANGMCQGVGEGFYATFFALLALGLRVIFAYALHNTALFGYTSIWWSQAMAWTVTLIVCYAHFFRGKWKTKSLIS